MRKHQRKNLQITLTNNSYIFLKFALARNFSKNWKNYVYVPGWLRDRLADRELLLLMKANENKPVVLITPPKGVPTEPSLTPPGSAPAEPKNHLSRGLDFKDEGNEGGGE
jgi:hypothetical protein